jgi:uncharacterized RDD family membrane protein YckC
VAREDLGSWLSGPTAARRPTDDETYRGERLGLPQAGAGSIASFGRRVVALIIDWIASVFVVRVALIHETYGSQRYSLAVLLVFAIENVLLIATLGSSLGQRLLHMRVVRLDGHPARFMRALGRTILLCLVVPAVIWDRDSRGLHDRAVATVLVNTR